MHRRRFTIARTSFAAGALLLLAACASRARSSAHFSPVVADSIRTERLAPGVVLHRLVQIHAPWRAYVLDVDLTRCVSVRPVKGGPVAIGRRTTSALLASVPASENPIAAVNADFFLFAPPGIPVGAHVESGHLLSGPVDRAVFAITDAGTPVLDRLSASVTITTVRGSVALRSWNRPARNVPGLVDGAWGAPLDSTITHTVWRLRPAGTRYVADTLDATDSRIARGDTLYVVELRSDAVQSLRLGDTVSVARSLSVAGLRHVVGGFPIMMRDSVISGAVDSVNDAGFRGVNPRTALGIAANGKRLLIIVIDGRQAGYSAGLGLRETAKLLRDMGARDAINLDGGGSSAMIATDPKRPGMLRTINKPSDAVGERPVANALAVVGTCSAK